jgi:hypothetical protein
MQSGQYARFGLNGFTELAAPAYIVSVAAIEAFVNEVFISEVSRGFEEDPLRNLDDRWLERLDVGVKLTLIPQLLYGSTLDKGRQPYQDMALLIKLRNDFVHYKMDERPPSYVSQLEQMKVALPRVPNAGNHPWPWKVLSSEGIRWANNTMCATAKALLALVPPTSWRFHTANGLIKNFREIGPEAATAVIAGLAPEPSETEKASVERYARLANLEGPPDKSKCAMCGSADTTNDIYGVGKRNKATGVETRNSFYLCAGCVPIMFADIETIQELSKRGQS